MYPSNAELVLALEAHKPYLDDVIFQALLSIDEEFIDSLWVSVPGDDDYVAE